jgi:ribosomal peptide maturation radical SAM protein 1
LRLALVAVPWAQYDTPAAAIGVLGAYVRREAPEVRTTCRYAYVDLWRAIEDLHPTLYPRIADNRLLGDLWYAAQLYPSPERTAYVRACFVDWAENKLQIPSAAALFDRVDAAVTEHLSRLATDLATSADVVGITTNASLFASLALSKRIKEKNPRTWTVLGGAILSYDNEPTLLREYPFVDFIVQNDGERRLVALLSALEKGQAPDIDGVLTQQTVPDGAHPPGTPRLSTGLDLEDLDDLPFPDYEEYRALAAAHSIGWSVPMEGSRGCWWCRVYRTGNTMHTCFFCSDIVADYREKSVERVAEEIGALGDCYRNVRIRFTDSILRHKDVTPLAQAIKRHRKSFRIFMEVRASIAPEDLLEISEAGTHVVQFGIEGLSTPYLRRIGKGTSAIQNLQALRSAFELDLTSASNLLIEFPGATAEEVAETARNVDQYALAYEPTSLTRFRLERGSAVFWSPEHFGVSNIRPHSVIRAVLPPHVAERLQYSYLEFDCATRTDWGPVESAWLRWRELHQRLASTESQEPRRPLFYYEGDSFLEIVDRRHGHRLVTLLDLWREVYLYAMQIRTRTALAERFGGLRSRDGSDVDQIVAALVREKLMFDEDGKVLSLAVAHSREAGAARIRAQAAEKKARPRVPRLAIVK